MKVVEIFDSMQGEGRYMGVMSTFVRFAGCNLDCPFCDEKAKYSKAKEMTIEEIAAQCIYTTVVLTGGEPTLQPALGLLVKHLHAEGHSVHVETNGTAFVPSEVDWITCSPKAPEYAVTPNGCNEMKLVVDEALSLDKAISLAQNVRCRVWLQPCDGPKIEESKRRILEWIRKYPILFRAGIQLHKWYEVI